MSLHDESSWNGRAVELEDPCRLALLQQVERRLAVERDVVDVYVYAVHVMYLLNRLRDDFQVVYA